MIQVLEESSLDGFTNMERDSLLLANAEQGVLGARVYSWDGPWVTLGRSQTAERDLLPNNTVPSVKRPTGGQGVLHGHDATIGLAIPIANVIAKASTERLGIRSVYRISTKPVLEALRGCGLDVALAVDTAWTKVRSDLPDCFAGTSELDIVNRITGEKLCGCAMRRKRDAVLLQASIPIGKPLVDPSSIFLDASSYIGPEWNSFNLGRLLEESLTNWFER